MADLTAQNKWEPLATDNSDREKSGPKAALLQVTSGSVSAAKPTAIAGFVIIIALMLFALVGPCLPPYDYSVQNLEVVNVPPVMKVYQIPNGDYLYITTALKVISVTPDGKLSGQLRKVRDESDKSMTIFDADGTEVALYYGGSPPLCHCR
jgi:oligopeptide transport system permease protein